MGLQQITTAAVLYFDRSEFKSVQLEWLDKGRRLFIEHRLLPVLFTASGGDFQFDDCYVLAEGCGEIALWGEWISARGTELIDAVRAGLVSSLGLDSPRRGGRNRDDSRLVFSVSAVDGVFYVGIDKELVSSPDVLVRRIHAISDSLPTVRYGIAYNMPLAQDPASYASGHGATPLSEVFEMIRRRREWERRPKSPDKLWSEELMGQKRHLTGFFRDAFPVNVVSELHVQRGKLQTCGIGTLSALSDSLWLWELSEQELPAARKMLHDNGLLIASLGSETP